jgi:hypothetical protein
MTEQMNGKADANDIPPTPQNVAAFISSYVGPVMTCAVNGCLRSLSNISVDAVMIVTCAIFGRAVGQTLSIGDLGPIMQLRARCIEAFTEELRKVKIEPIPKMPGKASITLPPDSAELVNKIKSGG